MRAATRGSGSTSKPEAQTRGLHSPNWTPIDVQSLRGQYTKSFIHLRTFMFNKFKQSLAAREVFELVQADLKKVEHEIGIESIASVEALTTINQYLQSGGGKRLRPTLLLHGLEILEWVQVFLASRRGLRGALDICRGQSNIAAIHFPSGSGCSPNRDNWAEKKYLSGLSIPCFPRRLSYEIRCSNQVSRRTP